MCDVRYTQVHSVWLTSHHASRLPLSPSVLASPTPLPLSCPHLLHHIHASILHPLLQFPPWFSPALIHIQSPIPPVTIIHISCPLSSRIIPNLSHINLMLSLCEHVCPLFHSASLPFMSGHDEVDEGGCCSASTTTALYINEVD